MVSLMVVPKISIDHRIRLIDQVQKLILSEFPDDQSPAVINHSMYSIKHTDYVLQHYDIVTYLDQLKYRIERATKKNK